MKLTGKHLVSMSDLTKEEFNELLDFSLKVKANPRDYEDTLHKKTLLMYFEKASTRTRISFETAMTQLGGHAIFFSGGHVEKGKEDLMDTAAMYSRYCDIVMARVYEHGVVEELAKYATIPVINALSDLEHPCQALADLLTVKEKKGFDGTTLAWVGDGDNVCNSLIIASNYCNLDFKIATPEGYEPNKNILEKFGDKVTLIHDPKEAVKGADVVFTDTWISMGNEAEKEKRLQDFKLYQVNSELMNLAKPDAIFMHCLPALKGFEVTAEVIEGPQSVVYDEAENRLHTQKALMIKLLED